MSTPTMAGPKVEEAKDCKALLASIENVVMQLNDMENMIEDFDDAMAEPLFAKVNEYIAGLKDVEKLAPSCRLQVPREALERLDDDVEQNPEVFAQELLTRCRDEFGQLNARLLGIKTVRKTVEDGWKGHEEGEVLQDLQVSAPNGIAPDAGTGAGASKQGEPRTGSGFGSHSFSSAGTSR